MKINWSSRTWQSKLIWLIGWCWQAMMRNWSLLKKTEFGSLIIRQTCLFIRSVFAACFRLCLMRGFMRKKRLMRLCFINSALVRLKMLLLRISESSCRHLMEKMLWPLRLANMILISGVGSVPLISNLMTAFRFGWQPLTWLIFNLTGRIGPMIHYGICALDGCNHIMMWENQTESLCWWRSFWSAMTIMRFPYPRQPEAPGRARRTAGSTSLSRRSAFSRW